MKVLYRRWSALRALLAATLLGGMLAVFGPAGVAKADPGCNSGGYYVLFVRGSGEKFNDVRANSFYWSLIGSHDRPGALGSGSVWAELGNLDGDGSVKIGSEYPAVPVNGGWVTNVADGAYLASDAIGVNELVTHLNDRYAGDGPRGNGPCSRETLVLGGYSQGANVIGDALRGSGLSQFAKNHIGFIALYGDPRFNPGSVDDRRGRTNLPVYLVVGARR